MDHSLATFLFSVFEGNYQFQARPFFIHCTNFDVHHTSSKGILTDEIFIQVRGGF